MVSYSSQNTEFYKSEDMGSIASAATYMQYDFGQWLILFSLDFLIYKME